MCNEDERNVDEGNSKLVQTGDLEYNDAGIVDSNCPGI